MLISHSFHLNFFKFYLLFVYTLEISCTTERASVDSRSWRWRTWLDHTFAQTKHSVHHACTAFGLFVFACFLSLPEEEECGGAVCPHAFPTHPPHPPPHLLPLTGPMCTCGLAIIPVKLCTAHEKASHSQIPFNLPTWDGSTRTWPSTKTARHHFRNVHCICFKHKRSLQGSFVSEKHIYVGKLSALGICANQRYQSIKYLGIFLPGLHLKSDLY